MSALLDRLLPVTDEDGERLLLRQRLLPWMDLSSDDGSTMDCELYGWLSGELTDPGFTDRRLTLTFTPTRWGLGLDAEYDSALPDGWCFRITAALGPWALVGFYEKGAW